MPYFFHYSNQKHETLEPQIGSARHKGEDPRAVNQPVVWLNSKQLDECNNNGITIPFCHIVEVAEDDPNLHRDESFARMMEQFEAEFGAPQDGSKPLRWFFYTASIPVLEVSEWDGAQYA